MARLGFQLDPGALDRKIEICTYTATQDAYGEELLTWSTLAIVPAYYEPMGGRERKDAEQEIAEYDAKFTIRYRADLERKMTVKYNGVTYDIENLAEIGRNQYLEIRAKARV